MKILIVEPFFSGSHKQWALSYQHSSQHDVDILSLPGHYWKWRMHGAAVSLAKSFIDRDLKPDFYRFAQGKVDKYADCIIFSRKSNHLSLVANRSGYSLAKE